MMNNLVSRIPRQLRWFFIFLLAFLAFYFIWKFAVSLPSTAMPQKFVDSERSAAVVAQQIINLTSDSEKNLKEINRLDEQKQYEEALSLVVKEIQRNNEAREKAIELSKQLGLMTESVSQISTAKNKEIALQAVNSEVLLINRLVTYNDYLNQLLEVLRSKFISDSQNTDGQVKGLVSKINSEVVAINDLNKQFSESIKKLQ